MKNAVAFCRKAINLHTNFLFFIIAVGFLLGLFFFIGLDHPLWGDEAHFVATVSYFGENLKLSTLKDYDQVTGPVVFILYALWGKLIGFEIERLRILSLLFSGATLLLIYQLFSFVLKNQKTALLAVCLLLINPYMWGLSIFVFTDIPTLFFLVLVAWAIYRQRPVWLFFAAAMALLSRQYSVYLIVAAGIYQFIHLIRGDRSRLAGLFALAISGMPLLLLMVLWKGIAPPSGVKRWVVAEEQTYHLSYITTYTSFMAAYLGPIILIMWRQLFSNKVILLVCVLFSFWYPFFPVRPSVAVLTQTTYTTVGLSHRMIQSLTQFNILETILLWALFWCGLLVICNLIYQDYRQFRNGGWDYRHFLTTAVVCFLLIMPFSYQVWEKYLIIILPFIMLRLVIMKYPPSTESFHDPEMLFEDKQFSQVV